MVNEFKQYALLRSHDSTEALQKKTTLKNEKISKVVLLLGHIGWNSNPSAT